MNTKKIVYLVCIITLVVAFSSNFVFAEKTYKMRLATPLSKNGSVGKGLKKFADLVQEKSGGRIKTSVRRDGDPERTGRNAQ